MSTASGEKQLVFPVALPGILYGQSATLGTMYLGYSTTAGASVTRVEVYRTQTWGNYRLVSTMSSATGDKIAITIPAHSRVLYSDDGLVSLRIYCNIPNGASIMFHRLEATVTY